MHREDLWERLTGVYKRKLVERPITYNNLPRPIEGTLHWLLEKGCESLGGRLGQDTIYFPQSTGSSRKSSEGHCGFGYERKP